MKPMSLVREGLREEELSQLDTELELHCLHFICIQWFGEGEVEEPSN